MRHAHAFTPFVFALLFSSVCSAQVPLRTRLDAMNRRFSAIDSALAQIERTDSIDAGADAIDAEMDAYAAEARKAFDHVMAEMRQYNNSRGASGSITAAAEFESVVGVHRRRADSIAIRMSAIDGKIRSGRVKLARPVIQQMTPTQKRQFRQSLTPRADSMSRVRLGPGDFPEDQALRHLTDAEWLAARASCRPQPSPQASRGRSLFGGVLELLVSTAHAAEPPRDDLVAAQCYATCSASFGLACGVCIVQGGAAAVTAWNRLSSCKSGCGTCRWYAPWRCACRAYCWTVFLATIG